MTEKSVRKRDKSNLREKEDIKQKEKENENLGFVILVSCLESTTIIARKKITEDAYRMKSRRGKLTRKTVTVTSHCV